jgi:hypothetical protein
MFLLKFILRGDAKAYIFLDEGLVLEKDPLKSQGDSATLSSSIQGKRFWL